MPFDRNFPRPLTSGAVQMYAPIASGVYGISNGREWIYIGETRDIQGALLAHLHDPHTMKCGPTGFVFEVCDQANRSRRQGRLVLEYGPTCKSLPCKPS
jgi:hypothetical protein